MLDLRFVKYGEHVACRGTRDFRSGKLRGREALPKKASCFYRFCLSLGGRLAGWATEGKILLRTDVCLLKRGYALESDHR
jgi:hypothetical protein